MNLALVQYASSSVLSIELINSIEQNINTLLKSKDYGKGLSTIYVGVICVEPVVDNLFKPKRNRLDKKDSSLTVEFKFEYNSFLESNLKERKDSILSELKKIPNIVIEKKIKDFDSKKFTIDFENAINSLI